MPANSVVEICPKFDNGGDIEISADDINVCPDETKPQDPCFGNSSGQLWYSWQQWGGYCAHVTNGDVGEAFQLGGCVSYYGDVKYEWSPTEYDENFNYPGEIKAKIPCE